jgi:hypothetical protein
MARAVMADAPRSSAAGRALRHSYALGGLTRGPFKRSAATAIGRFGCSRRRSSRGRRRCG